MINKKSILVVSFGTSHADTREKTIGAIEKDIAAAWPDYEVRRAFTGGKILEVLAKRDSILIDNVAEAMERLVSDGFEEIIVQSTHVTAGCEYDEMTAGVMPFRDKFARVKIGAPLLYRTDDYPKTVRGIMKQFPDFGEKEALVLIGHGTEHHINAAYAALDYRFKEMGYPNVFVGTVEAYPGIGEVLRQVGAYRPEKVVLLPLMVAAGAHAAEDMAGGEESSWKSVFEQAGYEVSCILKGLGEFKEIRDIYLKHVADQLKD